MEDIDQIMEGLSRETVKSIKEMSKCKDVNERKIHAETIKPLCESLGVFFEAMGMVSDGSSGFMGEFLDDE